MTNDDYLRGLAPLGLATLRALGRFEVTLRALDPPLLPELRERLASYAADLESTLPAFRRTLPPDALRGFHAQLEDGASRTLEALSTFLETPPPHEAIPRILTSMRTFCRALEALYPLHTFPPIGRFFVEPVFHDRLDALDPPPSPDVSVGMHGAGGDDARGGFTLYVPEHYDGSAALPLVVALHGGSGSGRDFVWTWLREARGRGFLLLAPTAQGSTWPLMGPDVDAPALRSMVRYVSERWRVKHESILLTGLSDGATYALLTVLDADSPFTAVAPVSGVVHPAVLAGARAERVVGRRIYLAHGARDWMFPVDLARAGSEQLRAAGADLVYRELGDLSHTYPREENDRILTWFDPTLALPAAGTEGS